ncbi:MAG: TolC family protein, partial [Elusimicrobia bacterium]|nr:TolC family protein [Elusimicrobiota bacterium]
MRAWGLALLFLLSAAARGWCRAPEPPLTLRQCVRLALETSPDLAAARAKLEESEAQLGKAYAPFSPQGSFTAEHTRLGYDPTTAARNRGGRWDAETRSASLNLQWNLFDGLRDLDRLSGARFDVGSASEAVTQARRQVVVDTVKAYFSILVASRSIEAQQEDLRSKQEHLDLAKARFGAGVRSYSDVLNSQIQLEQSRIGLIGQRTSRAAALRALDILIDHPLTEETAVADDLSFSSATEDLGADVAAALARRPELR